MLKTKLRGFSLKDIEWRDAGKSAISAVTISNGVRVAVPDRLSAEDIRAIAAAGMWSVPALRGDVAAWVSQQMGRA